MTRVKLPAAGSIDLPGGYEPQAFIFLGPMDGKAGLSAGPTAAKTVAHQIRRTITLTVSAIGGGEVAAGALGRALDEAKKACNGTVAEVGDRTLHGRPEKHALIRHRQGPMGVVSFVSVIHAQRYIWTVIHSCLDDPNAVAAVRAESEAFINAIEFSEEEAPVKPPKPKA
jgi:hypothetical protein